MFWSFERTFGIVRKKSTDKLMERWKRSSQKNYAIFQFCKVQTPRAISFARTTFNSPNLCFPAPPRRSFHRRNVIHHPFNCWSIINLSITNKLIFSYLNVMHKSCGKVPSFMSVFIWSFIVHVETKSLNAFVRRKEKRKQCRKWGEKRIYKLGDGH